MGHYSGLSHLLSSGRIGTLETRNRIIMSAMGSNLGDGNGFVGERMKRYYETRAQGGAGLIIVEVVLGGVYERVAIENHGPQDSAIFG